MSNAAFFPTAPTTTIAAGVASVNGTIQNPERGTSLRVFNAGAGIAFFRTGIGAQTAVVTDIPCAPNSVEVFRIPNGHTDFGVILSVGTQNVYITKGEGV